VSELLAGRLDELDIGGHSRLTRIVGISSCSLTVAASGNIPPSCLYALRIRVRRAWMALRTRAGCDGNRPRELGAGACGGADGGAYVR
jgi:hypothetical protein